MAPSRHLCLQGLCVFLLGTVVGGQDLEVRLKDGAHRCEGRVEVKHHGEWGTVDDDYWSLKDASVVCRQLGCGTAIGFPGRAYFGPGLGPIWLLYTLCKGTESTVSDCRHSDIKDYRNNSYAHDRDTGVVCSGFARLAGGDGPCSGRVEVHSGEAWIPVSDGNFTLPTAQVICAELGCGKAVSILGHVPFRESDGQVWAEEFRCEGEEPELRVCPRVPCPGGTCHHSGAAQVVCSAYSEVRLMTNGSSQCEGQVEVNISGRWRVLCASHWSLANANVVCHQLGCGVAISTPRGPHLVEEGDQISTVRFHCSGAESFLWSCPVTVLGGPDCSHGNRASVICSGNQTQVLPQCNNSLSEPAGSAASKESSPYCSDSRQLRLVDGGGPCAGRVEILDQGSWGTICDDGWDLDDAHVVCRQLGCGPALNATGFAHFGAGSGPIWLDNLNCTGKESHVWRCPSRGWGQHDCRHQQDAGVICSDSRQLRLVDGGGPCAGRVEILDQGSWGTICDDRWDLDDARVVCRQLSCGEALDATVSSYFGAGSGPIWLDEVSCRGEESQVWRCPSWGWRQHNCDHQEDAGVICSGFVHLAGGDGPCSGRVEVRSGEAWTPVSDGNFTLPIAQVICAELGCGKAVSVLGHEPIRESDGRVWAEEFRCQGEEPKLWSCPRVPCPGGMCHHSGAAQVVCSVYTEVQLMKNGTSQCEGRVEMNISGQWRALCASHWSLANANVVCRQLSCGIAISTPNGAEGSDQLWKARFHCSGTESFLWQCPVTALGVPDCSHGNTASVICSGNYTQVLPQCNDSLSEVAGSAASEESAPYCSDSRQLRLVDGGGPCAGRVEIFDHGSWGTICDDGWDLEDAHVVCRQLGCGEALNATESAHFGAGSGPIWLDDLNCTGKESHVWKCPSRGWGRHDCRHKEDAGVICSDSRQLRLVDGGGPCAGRVEILDQGSWGTICDDGWDLDDAHVVCRQLGCGEALNATGSAHFGAGSGPIWLDDLNCTGKESHVWRCPSRGWGQHDCRHKQDAGVICSGARQLRLVDGDGPCSGRVEILDQGSWGTICDDGWDLDDARVVCRQLGCGGALDALQSAQLGQGSGPIWLDELNCGGKESHVWRCPSRGWGRHDCGHAEDAGVVCSDSRQLRLVDGGGHCAGRVEILDQGSWGTICDDGWDLDDAHVVCRQLGCGEALNATRSAHFGEGSGPIWLDDLNCTGNESHVWRCPSRGWGQHDCRHKEDVGVICSGARQLRLVDGGGHCAGRVEILDQGSWGTICDDGWDLDDAHVVCRQLGCGEALNAAGSAHFGAGSGPIWLDDLNCTGNESYVWRCPSQGWGRHACRHKEDAGVICSGPRQLRLVDKGGPCTGRVEILDQGSWGTICDDSWDLDDARVVCRQLGCGEALNATRSAHFGAGSGPIWLDDLNCTGNESYVWRCPSQGWGRHACRHKEDAGVICSGPRQLRLVDGGGPCAGRVEILDQGSWGTICDDGWDLDDAHVVCRQLGCGEALNATGSAHFGAGSGPIWLDDLNCTGKESHVWRCPSRGWGQHDCRHKQDAGVVCSDSRQLRLVDGGGPCAGRVEILDQGSWGTICDDRWDLDDARVVCRQLGCGEALDATVSSYFGAGSGPIWLDEVSCRGEESQVWRCPSWVWRQHNCDHQEDAGVICSDSRQLRLVDGGGPCAGRVEILDQGSWGTICDDGWDLDDARVVCRQLGCGKALNATGSAHFGAGSGPIWLDDLNCSGNESHVWRCPSRGWGRHYCRHKEDAGVICSEFLALRMVSEDQECAGWLEVFYNGTWGSVCRSPMGDITVSIICRQLGCGDSGSLNTSVGLREGSRPRWVDGIQCRKTDTSLWQCPSDPWKYSSCSPKEEAYISCAGRRPQSCPAAAPCTDREKLRLRGGDSECSGRVEVWHRGSWGTVCDDSWSLAEAEVVCQQLGCGPALEAVRAAAFGPGSGSIWLDEVRCGGRESSLWACAAGPWGQSDCKHEEDAGVRCSGVRKTVPPTAAGSRPVSSPLPGIFSLPGVLCLILGALLFLVLVILVTQVLRWRAERRELSDFEDAVDEAVYQEIDDIINPGKKDLLDSQGNLSDDSAAKLPYYTGDDGEDGGSDSAPEPPGQNINTIGNGYDDVDELSVPVNPLFPGMNENNFFPDDRGGARYSQTGISLKSLRETVDSGVEEKESSLVLRQEEHGYDDVELSTM
uniref:Uncharacterized protein n=1 Tax=Rangifer tarandus platyrhynchus TaxID=3082113 RepID=A0ACB0E0S3_RANTA|nr:unnamed protein product [Rangifer tarandus platyrhynchus]